MKKDEEKIITVAFVVNDLSAGEYDASKPQNGNPGMGGTQYCFIALATEFAKISSNIKPVLFHNNDKAILAPFLEKVCVTGGEDVIAEAVSSYNPDIAIVRGCAELLLNPLVNQTKFPLIAWVHNHFPRNILNAITNSPAVRHTVFCAVEQRMLTYDSLCFQKSESIFNIHYPLKKIRSITQAEASAVYIGSVIPSKGLHRILRLWPKIKEKCPNAKLHVIGSGALYDSNAKLGPNKIAENRYEKKLFNYLANTPEKYGVIFHGLLKEEKFEILESCSVGIPNPTAFTECCPGSVLECSASGLAVVGCNKFGMVDTIVNETTGFLVESDLEMINKIVYLFENHENAKAMGENGKKFIEDQFSPEKIVNQWMTTIKNLISNDPCAVVDSHLELKGKYRYSAFIQRNSGGHNHLFSLLRDVLSKIEHVEAKLR